MQFLALTRRLTETFSEADFAAVLPAEAEQARGLYARGVFRSINSRGDLPGAVILLEAADVADATAIVGALPLAQKKMMDVSIVPLLPYRGFTG
ncbi:MAG: muconolactone Delta-isomerase family protein [Vulcanimicrobiaceae bacterium]